jgi:hypothetical protein
VGTGAGRELGPAYLPAYSYPVIDRDQYRDKDPAGVSSVLIDPVDRY